MQKVLSVKSLLWY